MLKKIPYPSYIFNKKLADVCAYQKSLSDVHTHTQPHTPSTMQTRLHHTSGAIYYITIIVSYDNNLLDIDKFYLYCTFHSSTTHIPTRKKIHTYTLPHLFAYNNIFLYPFLESFFTYTHTHTHTHVGHIFLFAYLHDIFLLRFFGLFCLFVRFPVHICLHVDAGLSFEDSIIKSQARFC